MASAQPHASQLADAPLAAVGRLRGPKVVPAVSPRR
jgi:hypothetical protein